MPKYQSDFSNEYHNYTRNNVYVSTIVQEFSKARTIDKPWDSNDRQSHCLSTMLLNQKPPFYFIGKAI